MKTELLAPAGDLEAAYSAFYFGADAIYLGLKQFSARAEAINFSESDLDEITAYAHHNHKKVYVALNTLIQENELPDLMKQLALCDKYKVDALIVQDFAVARIIKKSFPNLILHASTQMAVHNLEGALALKKMGFERVVPARELTYDEIMRIKELSGLEVEVFIHGALCYSYSGLCNFSALTTGRSANRGKCVYSCRSLFTRAGKSTHPFSMKDLALEEDVKKLQGFSLKIEGRKKNALYVGAVTKYYRHILDTGHKDISLSDNIKQIFARPWTKLHFNGKNKDITDVNYVGHRGLPIGTILKIYNGQITFKTLRPIARYDGIQIDIPNEERPFGFSLEEMSVNNKHVFEASAGQVVTITLPNHPPFIPKGAQVYLASSTKVKGAYSYQKPKAGLYKNRIPLFVSVFLDKNSVTAFALGTSVTLEASLLPATHIEKVISSVKSCFEKTGDTPFELSDFTLENPHNLFAPVSLMNELRRKLYEAIPQTDTIPALPDLPKTMLTHTEKETKWALKTDNLSMIKDLDLSSFDEIIITITPKTTPADLSFLQQDKVTLALPTVIRQTKPYQKVIAQLFEAGFLRWQITNIAGFYLIPAKAHLSLDSTIGMMNTQAIAFMRENNIKNITFSIEDYQDNIKLLSQKTLDTTLVVYQDTPLFTAGNCVRENTCADCSHKRQEETIKDKNTAYTLISDNCQTTLIKATPFYIAHLSKNISVGTKRIDFCNRLYKKEEMQEIIQAAQAGIPLKNTYSANFSK